MSFLRLAGPRQRPWSGAVALPAEVAFLLAEGFDPALLARGVALARAAGTDAATALLHAGLIAEEAYYRALARALGAPFLDAFRFGPSLRFPDSLVLGAAPLAPGSGPPLVLAPRGAQIVELLAGSAAGGRVPAITSPSLLRAGVFAAIPEAVAAEAADGLRVRSPEWSIGPRPLRHPLLLLALCLATLACLHAALPPAAALVAGGLAQVLFLAMTAFRLAALGLDAPVDGGEAPPLPEADLPTYSVVVALYREARVVPRLVLALARLDYPASRLDVTFVVEADDSETIAALARAPFPSRFTVVAAPPGLPRTKPRALNVALPLARGRHLVVYDAEDVPEPDQLRRAAAIFARAPATVACLQGRLV